MTQQHCGHECVCDNFHPEYDPDYQEICNNSDCPHDTRSRPAPQQPNLSCLGNYERDPCLMPACPIKVKCREYTELRKQPPASAALDVLGELQEKCDTWHHNVKWLFEHSKGKEKREYERAVADVECFISWLKEAALRAREVQGK